MTESLHLKVAELTIQRAFDDCIVLRDQECGGFQTPALYCTSEKSRKTKLCEVDILILKNNEIRAIIEIEESDTTPVRILGKFFASALSLCLFDDVQTNTTPINMTDSVCFVQILDTSNLEEDRTSKFEQWKTVETLIHRIMRVIQTNIKKYVILWGRPQDFKDKGSEDSRELLDIIGEALK